MLKGHVEVVRLLLPGGVDQDAKDAWKLNPIHFATKRDSLEVLEVLLEHGADVNAAGRDGWTLLHDAVLDGERTDVVRLLLAYGAAVDTKSELGETPLHFAAMWNRKDEAKLLLAHGAEVNARTVGRMTPLHFASYSRDLAEVLLAHGAAVDAENEYGETPLHSAAEYGHRETARLLLTNGAAVDAKDEDGMTALYFAAIGDHVEVVRLLKHFGAEEDPKRIRLTHKLIRAACKGYEMQKPGEGYPLYPGVVGDVKNAPWIVDVLYQEADVNWADANGYTPLMYAANLGLVENVKILLANGADMRLKANDGQTALSLTERLNSSFNIEERKQVVELLKQHLASKL